MYNASIKKLKPKGVNMCSTIVCSVAVVCGAWAGHACSPTGEGGI